MAQEVPIFKWAKQTARGTGDEYSTDVTTDAAGNVFSVGASTGTADYDPGAGTFSLSANVFVSKLDANGNFLWAKGIAAAGVPSGQGSGIVADASGNVYVTGFFTSTVDFDPGPSVFNLTASGTRDLFVLKLDGNGNFVWAKNFNPDYGNSIAYDPAGFIYVTSSNSPSSQCSVVKLDTDGNSIWTRTITGGQTAGVSVSVDPTGNIVATGWMTGTADFDPGAGTLNLTVPSLETGLFIWKLNGSGDLVWAKQLPRGSLSSIYLFDSGSSLDAAGNIYLSSNFNGTQDFDPGAGTFTLSASSGNMFVCKLDGLGNFVWAKNIGTSICNFISSDASGNSYITGWFVGTVDFDPGAGVFNLTSAGNDETYILKLNASGNFVWATRIGSPSDDEGTAIHADASGNFYLTSYFYQFADFDPTCGTQTLTSGGNADAYILKLSSTLAPTVTSFTPSSGIVGTVVSITGTNFGTPTSSNIVAFNGRGAVVSASGTTSNISATVPSGATTGKISVRVGCNSATSAINFTVTAGAIPTITSFAPTSGPIGTTVIITGTNFSTTPANNTVKFYDGIDSYVVSSLVTASTSTSITTTVPNGAFTGKIKVTTAGGTATSPSDFIVTCGPTPTITSFSPITGTPGTIVTITGTNFSSTPSNNIVDFGGTTATVTASTSTSITTSVPTGPVGLVPIMVTIACNIVTSSTDFDVTCPPAPTITSFTPGTGAVGAVVTITGTNFSTNPLDNLVDFNGEPAIVTASTATSITTTVPANAFSGPINVYVGCNVASSTTAFIVDCGPAPTITSFSPSNGLAGTVITIAGTNFSTTPANNFVDFNGELAVVTASTATSMTTTVPVGAITGPITIVVACNYITSTTDFTVGNIITITTQPSDFIACVGQTATFTNAASGATNIIYQWQFSPDGIVPFTDIANGGGYSNATTATLFVNTTGNFGLGRYRCRINGDFASEIITNDEGLFINPISTAPTVVGANRCGAGSVTLTASGGANGQYTWYTTASGGTAIVGETNGGYVTPSLTSTTSYYVSLNTNGCESTRALVTATINSLPGAPTSPVNGSSCGTGTVTISVSGGTNGQYRWYTLSTGGIAISGETNSSYTTPSLSTTTTYYVALNMGGCESTTRTAVTATINPIPTTPGASGISICSTTSATISATGGTNGQYRWYTVPTGGAAIVGQVNATYVTPTLTSTTTYYVALNILSCEGARTSATVTVNPLPASPTITSTKTPTNGNVLLCTENNESTTLATVPAGFASYLWSNGQTVASFSTNQAGNITVRVTDINGCQSVSSAVLIITSASCKPTISTTTINTSIGGTVSESILSLIKVVGTLNPASLRVVTQPASGAVASIGVNGILVVNYSGIQFVGKESVTIEACDTNGICATQSITIEVTGEVIVFNAISPNGDGKNEFLVLQYIESISPKNQVSIYNRWGDEVFSISDYDNKTRVFAGLTNGGSKLPGGTYFYKVNLMDIGKTLTGFVVVKN